LSDKGKERELRRSSLLSLATDFHCASACAMDREIALIEAEVPCAMIASG
jgi:hypothetical protein